MRALRRMFHLLPKSARRALIGALDRAVPERLRLPYVYMQLGLQNALEEEMRWLPKLVKRDGVAIDVGANIGLYSYRLCKLCRQVEAFEPNPDCLAVLDAYGAQNVRTHGVALSSEPGTLVLNIPIVGGVAQSGFGSATLAREVESIAIEADKRRLDDFHFSDVCFIKIDVEGHELEVLTGAERTVRRDHPVLLVEIEERHQPLGIKTVFSVAADCGYQGFFLFEGSAHPLEQFDVEYHQRGYLDGRQSIKYVNNFIFLPSDQAGSFHAGN